jgi:hypothetical protein
MNNSVMITMPPHGGLVGSVEHCLPDKSDLQSPTSIPQHDVRSTDRTVVEGVLCESPVGGKRFDVELRAVK